MRTKEVTLATFEDILSNLSCTSVSERGHISTLTTYRQKQTDPWGDEKYVTIGWHLKRYFPDETRHVFTVVESLYEAYIR